MTKIYIVNFRSIFAVLALVLALGSGGCNNSPRKSAGTDGGGADANGDVPRLPVLCSAGGDAGANRKAMGQACGCDGDCQSNFCVDGVCCNSACTETCKACNVAATVGTCSFVPPGLKPRSSTTCVATDATSCGLDGTCDGQGGCRKHPAGTTCKGGTCEGDAVSGIEVCDGEGRCRPGAVKVCAPFTCDPTKKDCYPACTKNTDCVTGVACVNGSCGPKMKGAVCAKDAECASGFCADGTCCSVACKGACVSCNQVGHLGTCWPIEVGNPDPHAICKDSGAASCGETGTCDGFGSCAKYAAETICVPPVCSGDRLNTSGTCDGMGSCRPPGVQDCPPFRCVDGACNTRCTSDTDCAAGIACVNGSCGPKQNGQICKAGTECQSGNCVDGVCCSEACGGPCRSCALPSAMGKCTPVPAGNSDTRGSCTDQGAASCGTDGRCDGAGACRKYRPGTVCAGERCSGNVYTAAATCSSTGQCVPPGSRPCAPFVCNGQRCFDACTSDRNCVAPNVCNGNSCGKKINGADCSNGGECASGQCWQGVCCGTTCRNACKSCALPGTEGTCANVPSGAADPSNSCVDQGAASCGTNGRCAAGACQRYAAGTSCQSPTCPTGTTTFTGRSTCDGAGRCATPEATSCFPFKCGTNACRSACNADADCAAGAVCVNGSCGLKPKGSPCASSGECSAGLVCSAQNVCCDAACDGPCVSCTLAGTPGTCAAVPANQDDPNGKCGVSAAATCGNDGKCDGDRGCRKHAAGTQCVPPSCPTGASTVTLAKTCDGAGSCIGGGGTRSCAPFLCNGSDACNDTCRADTDCVAGNSCIDNRCGKLSAGARCSGADQCAAGLFCTDGVCCTSSGCGDCKSCNSSGTCGNDDGASCGSSDMCHVEGRCVGGTCANPTIGCDDNNPCTADSCNPATGCQRTPIAGTCDDGNSCTTGDSCVAKKCTGDPVVCAAPPQCKMAVGACDAATGQCRYADAPNGSSCNDGNACTQSDSCQAGLCVGANPVTCPAPGPCETAGTCNPNSGVCANTPKPNDSPCDDGNRCTRSDSCQAGACRGSPVVCAATDQCHDPGSCDPDTGTCSNPPKTEGATCSDGNPCTRTDSCQSGRCLGADPVTCTPQDACHVAGVCDPRSGSCTNPAGNDGESCSDNNSCTAGDVCRNGTCQGAPISCPPPGQCQVAAPCDATTGECAYRNKDDGSACDDGNSCTKGDVCGAGVCLPGTPVVCVGQCLTGACEGDGLCTAKPNGSACDDGDVCTERESCRAGLCDPGRRMMCPGPGRPICDPLTGCATDPLPL